VHVLIIIFFTAPGGNACYGKPCVGVSMQEFSSIETCQIASKSLDGWSKQMTTRCVKK